MIENPEEGEPEKPHKKNASNVKGSERPVEVEYIFRAAVFTGGKSYL